MFVSLDRINYCDLFKFSFLYIWLGVFFIIGFLLVEMVGEMVKGYYNFCEKEWFLLKRCFWCENNVIGGLYVLVIVMFN